MTDAVLQPPVARREGARRVLLGIGGAWLVLVTLMLISLGSAYLPLGAGNLAIGLVVAALKASLVAWSYMQLRRAPGLTRMVAAIGFAFVLLLMALSGLDHATRRTVAAPWQVPHQLTPTFGPAAGRPSAQPTSRTGRAQQGERGDAAAASISSPGLTQGPARR